MMFKESWRRDTAITVVLMLFLLGVLVAIIANSWLAGVITSVIAFVVGLLYILFARMVS